MVMMQDALPGVNRFLKGSGLGPAATRHVVGFVVAFAMHIGRMSAVQAAAAIRIKPRHRAQVMRFLAKQYAWSKDWRLLNHYAQRFAHPHVPLLLYRELFEEEKQESPKTRRHPLSPPDGVGCGIGAQRAGATPSADGRFGRYGFRRRANPASLL